MNRHSLLSKKMQFKPQVSDKDAHEYHRRIAEIIEEPIVCPKCKGTGTMVDYKTKLVTICLYCEGEGVVYE
jgi:DnaJ-class molecular chaperone